MAEDQDQASKLQHVEQVVGEITQKKETVRMFELMTLKERVQTLYVQSHKNCFALWVLIDTREREHAEILNQNNELKGKLSQQKQDEVRTPK